MEKNKKKVEKPKVCGKIQKRVTFWCLMFKNKKEKRKDYIKAPAMLWQNGKLGISAKNYYKNKLFQKVRKWREWGIVSWSLMMLRKLSYMFQRQSFSHIPQGNHNRCNNWGKDLHFSQQQNSGKILYPCGMRASLCFIQQTKKNCVFIMWWKSSVKALRETWGRPFSNYKYPVFYMAIRRIQRNDSCVSLQYS